MGVAGDAGIVDQHIDRAEFGLDLLDAGDAGLEGGDIPFVDGDTGLGPEFLRRFVVAAVIGCDLIARRLERLGDRRADTACSPRHHCNPCHKSSLSWLFLRERWRSDAGCQQAKMP